MKEILFIYHANCFDGFTAAWVFEKFRSRNGLDKANVTYHPAIYGQDPPDCKGKEVWLVDYTFPRDVMLEKIILPSTRTIILDHHKTAEAALDKILQELRRKYNVDRVNDLVLFDMNRSGAGLIYDFLSEELGRRAGVHRPKHAGREYWLVDYVEDRDLWRHKLPLSEEVSAYYASIPFTFQNWDGIQALGFSRVAEGGRAVQRYINTYGDKAREMAKYETIAGHLVPTINIPYMNCSDHVNGLLRNFPIAPFAAGFFRRADGRWQFSLRSRGDFDVSEVATQFGGGGHKAAAGFDVEKLPWETTA